MPGRPVSFLCLGHHGGPAFLAADRQLQGGIVHCIQSREVAFTWDTEHMLHALDLQLINEDFPPVRGVGGIDPCVIDNLSLY